MQLPRVALLSILLAACSGGSEPRMAVEGVDGNRGLAEISTLAWVESSCELTAPDADGARFLIGEQRLLISDGATERVVVRFRSEPLPGETVLDVPNVPGATLEVLCEFFGVDRGGDSARIAYPVQDVTVSADGSLIAFEVDERFSVLPTDLLTTTADDWGVFTVRPGGAGLRRVHPPRGVRSWFPRGLAFSKMPHLSFPGTARMLAFAVETAPPPMHEEEIFVVDLESGNRRQITRLGRPFTCCPRWRTEYDALDLVSRADPPPSDTEQLPEFDLFRATVDGTRVDQVGLSTVDGGKLQFDIVGDVLFPFADVQESGFPEIVLRTEGRDVQLTKLDTPDTSGPIITEDGGSVLFRSSYRGPDNPHGNCQVFRVSLSGADLRQVTHFDRVPSGEPNGNACNRRQPGCFIRGLRSDAVTGAIVFASGCDPMGEDDGGVEIFAIWPDGTGLRQLTHTRGVERRDDGGIFVELPGLHMAATKSRTDYALD